MFAVALAAVVAAPVPSRPNSDVLPGQSLCAADGNVYTCLAMKCHYMRPCASDSGLLHCSCQPPTRDQLMSMLGDSRQAAEMSLVSPCLKVEVGKPLTQWRDCEAYLATRLTLPRQGCRRLIPRVVYSMGKSAKPSMETKMIMSVSQSGFYASAHGRPARSKICDFSMWGSSRACVRLFCCSCISG